MSKSRGFSLIELLIVVAIILIIAAIAIPNLLRARIAANESSAVQSIRTINTAQVTYQSQFPNLGYASALSQLGPTASTGCTTPTSAASCLLDYVLSNATAATKPKSGYYFTVPATVTGGGINVDYTVNGLPAAAGQTGVRGFCSNSDGVIRYNNPAAAAASNSACAGLTALQ
jgi:type IV pilus assembly protein PilA